MTKNISQSLLILLTSLALCFSLVTVAFAEEDTADTNDDDSSMTSDDDSDDDADDSDETEDASDDDSDDATDDSDDTDKEKKERVCDKENRTDNKKECLKRLAVKCKADTLRPSDRERKFCRDGEWKEKKEARMSDIVDGFIEAKDLSNEEAAQIRKEVEILIRQLITLLLANRGL